MRAVPFGRAIVTPLTLPVLVSNQGSLLRLRYPCNASGVESPPNFHCLEVTAIVKFPFVSVNPLATSLLIDWKNSEMPGMPRLLLAASTKRPEMVRVAGERLRFVAIVAPAASVSTGDV